jgi:hypothetical protein
MTREPDYGGEDCSANGAPSPRRSGLNLICFVGGSSGLPGERTIVKDRDGEAHTERGDALRVNEDADVRAGEHLARFAKRGEI